MDREAFRWLAIDAKTESDLLTVFFEQLTLSMGGSGVDGAALFPDGHVETLRGVTVWEEHVAQWMREAYRSGAISFTYHTRAASMGGISDANCHPQQCVETYLCHNGHDVYAESIASHFGYHAEKDATDTAAIAYMANMFGPEKILPYMSGNFLGYYNGKPFQVLGKSSYWELLLMRVGDNGHIWTSELPKKVDQACYTYVDLNPYASRWDSFGWTMYNDETYPTKKQKKEEKKLQTVKQYLEDLDFSDLVN